MFFRLSDLDDRNIDFAVVGFIFGQKLNFRLHKIRKFALEHLQLSITTIMLTIVAIATSLPSFLNFSQY